MKPIGGVQETIRGPDIYVPVGAGLSRWSHDCYAKTFLVRAHDDVALSDHFR